MRRLSRNPHTRSLYEIALSALAGPAAIAGAFLIFLAVLVWSGGKYGPNVLEGLAVGETRPASAETLEALRQSRAILNAAGNRDSAVPRGEESIDVRP
jgi:hypothetical protein